MDTTNGPSIVRLLLSIHPIKTCTYQVDEETCTVSISLSSSDRSCLAKLAIASTGLFLRKELEIFQVSFRLLDVDLVSTTVSSFFGEQGNFPADAIVVLVPSQDISGTYTCHGLDDLVSDAVAVSQAVLDYSAQTRALEKHPIPDILAAPPSSYKQVAISNQGKIEILSQNIDKVSRRLSKNCNEVVALAEREGITRQIHQLAARCNACTRVSLTVMKNYQDSVMAYQHSLFGSSSESPLLRDIAEKTQLQLFIHQAKLKACISSTELSSKLLDTNILEVLLSPVSSFYDNQVTRQAIMP